jgi:PAS domain S-box-containing protein
VTESALETSGGRPLLRDGAARLRLHCSQLTGQGHGFTLDGMSGLRVIGGDMERALEQVNVPSYVIDPTGIIRWINPAAERLVGDVRGSQFTSVVAPHEKHRSREVFAKNIAGTIHVTDAEVVLLDDDGDLVSVELSSVPLHRGERVIGVFGQIVGQSDDPPVPPHPALTPRQAEVLRLLGHGRSTVQIAEELHLSRETVRNHIRHLLKALGVHSRLEAVALARHEHLAGLT